MVTLLQLQCEEKMVFGFSILSGGSAAKFPLTHPTTAENYGRCAILSQVKDEIYSQGSIS